MPLLETLTIRTLARGSQHETQELNSLITNLRPQLLDICPRLTADGFTTDLAEFSYETIIL